MKKARKIKFDGTGQDFDNGLVHLVGPINDYTLCGLTLDGDTATLGGYKKTRETVTCDQCITIVKYCHAINL